MPDIAAILDDLVAEHADLDAIVAPLAPDAWSTATPAEGWDIRDQIGHLAFFDDQATLALSNPEGFQEKLQEIARDVGAFMDRSVTQGRELDPEEVLKWWRTARGQLLVAARAIDHRIRIPWYGPPMSPASFISARQMETWAHAQDVADGLGIARDHSDRIRNVAHLCVLARAHSYANRGLPIPEAPVRVELTSPSGAEWTWGEGDQKVSGSAIDFCLVVTQRRHPEDTDLVVAGGLAHEWMSIAQAYAGPPGSGRKPGQFARS